MIRGRVEHPSARGKNPARSSPSGGPNKARDPWDKADIIAKFLSSVVIAVIGLLITWSIQTTQIETNKAIAQAQLDAAKLKAQDDRRLQESQITVQLVNHLISKEPLQREVAVIALRQSVAAPTYDAIVQVLATSDSSENVRIAAIKQLATSTSPQAARTLTSIVADDEKSVEERMLAAKASEQVALSSVLDSRTYIFAASNINTSPLEDGELRSGVFTYALIKGSEGVADANSDGRIAAAELWGYLRHRVMTLTSGKQVPVFSGSLALRDDLFAVEGEQPNAVVVAVGISRYSPANRHQVRDLRFAA